MIEPAPITSGPDTVPPYPQPVHPWTQLQLCLATWRLVAPIPSGEWQTVNTLYDRLRLLAAERRFVFPWKNAFALAQFLRHRTAFLESEFGMERSRDMATGRMIYQFRRIDE